MMTALKYRRLALALVGVASLWSGQIAQAQDELSETDRQKILAKLEELKETAKKSTIGKFGAASAAYEKASSSPSAAAAFYFECSKVVEFDRRGRSFSDFRDWKARELERVRSTEYATVLQIQLKHLVLTVRYINMEDKAKIVQPLQTYLDALVTKEKSVTGRAREELQRGVGETVFAEAYYFDKALAELEGWEMTPLNLRGYYENTILPILRENGTTTSIEAAWDRLIKLEAALIANRKNDGMEEEFKKTSLPVLLWAKWSDVADHGGRVKACHSMLAILEKNITHRDAESWALDLEDVANGVRLSD